jgi:methyltransferase (TIGR00027 family)
MAELVDVAVFEVDHPATQAYKRRRAAELPRRSAALVYVPVDFERDDLGTRLAAAGHRADLPTAWIWEGVTMYLTDGAFEGTLRAIAGRSAPASVVLVHYLPPPEPHEARDAEVRTMRTIVRVWSEPLIGMRPPEAVARAVADAGLELVGDTGAEEWARTFGSDPVMVFGGRSRLAVARAIRPSRTLR